MEMKKHEYNRDMRIAYFYRLDKFGTHLRFVEEGKALGVEVVPVQYKKLSLRKGRIYFESEDVAAFDAWYFRSVGTELEWAKLLELYAKKLNKTVVDEYLLTQGPLRRFKSVMGWQLDENGVNYPTSVMLPSIKHLREELAKKTLPAIVKLSQGGRHGMGTFMIKSIDQVDELETLYEQRKAAAEVEGKEFRPWGAVLVQDFIENDGDYRVVAVGYKVIAGFKRQMKEDKLVLNKSVGRSEALKVVPEDVRETAEAAARAVEVEVAGIDLVKDKQSGRVYVVEVNEAPEFKVMEKRTGVNVPAAVINYIVGKHGR